MVNIKFQKFNIIEIIRPLIEQVGKMCCLVDHNYASGHIKTTSQLFLLKEEFHKVCYQLIIVLKDGFDNQMFDMTHMGYIGRHLLSFVLICGMTSFRAILKDVLNVNINLSEELLTTFLKNIPHGRYWHVLLIPIRNIVKKRNHSTESIELNL